MNTHDIKLPPLPPGYKSYEFPDGGYDGDEMQDYARSSIEPYAKRIEELEAQIEADRKRRGEPVGYLVELDGRDTYVSADRTVRDSHLTYGWRPVYASPQPAEMVKYWLCCGSTDLTHADRKQPDCYDPDKAKFGTSEIHKEKSCLS